MANFVGKKQYVQQGSQHLSTIEARKAAIEDMTKEGLPWVYQTRLNPQSVVKFIFSVPQTVYLCELK